MAQRAVLGAFVMILAIVAGCTSFSSQEQHKAYTPHINPAEFTTTIDNEYFPMKPGTTFIYEGKGERDEMRVTHDTKKTDVATTTPSNSSRLRD